MSKSALREMEEVASDYMADMGQTIRKGDLRQPKGRKDLCDRLPIYGTEPVFGRGPIPASGRGMNSLSQGGVRREGFRKGHMPTLDDYDRRQDRGVRTVTSLQGMSSLHEMFEEMDGTSFGDEFEDLVENRFEGR